jgi:23S rRNA (uracil1939-C5)-methyltransferase
MKRSGLRPGNEVHLHCARLDERGAGVAETGGLEVHVAGALPGEQVAAVLEHVSPHRRGDAIGARAWARLATVIAPSPERVATVCPAYGPCGGCPMQHLHYPAQVRWKGELVRAAFAGQPALAATPIAGCVPSPLTLGYRNQGKYVYGVTRTGRPVLGGYAARSHAVVDLAGCRVVEPAVDEVAGLVRQQLEEDAVAPFDEGTGHGVLRYIVIRANAREQVLVTLVAARRDWEAAPRLAGALRAADRRVVGVVLNVNGAPGNVLYGPEETVLAGRGTLLDQIGDVEVQLASRSFFQVNRSVAALAYQDLRAAAAELGPIDRAVDAYAGAGAIAFGLASLAGEVVAIEENAAAATAAAAAGTQPGRVRFVTGDVAEHLATVGSAELVVLNPPRGGCEPAVLAGVAQLRPRLVAYLSCRPSSLTRDLEALRRLGLVPVAVRPYDMLPHTAHVETLALLAPATRR